MTQLLQTQAPARCRRGRNSVGEGNSREGAQSQCDRRGTFVVGHAVCSLAMPPILHGYRYSVYNRIARLALAEKGVAYERVEVNPFAPDVPASYLALHPFNRVPTLVHDGFALYETGAITRYVDRAFPSPSLQPATPRALARM